MEQDSRDSEGRRGASDPVTDAAVAHRTPVRLAAAALPACLGDLSTPPAGLWCLGHPDVLQGAPDRFVAIVGPRESSPYGERIAARLAAAAARAGLVVVSGLARGIDAAAHHATIAAGGRTVAVQGTGVDVPYPVSHRTLHELVQQTGCVVAEMEPGSKAFAGAFPRRNRIIAALAKVTVVVEAGFKSGAINTATHALDLGRIVAAVPGPIDDPRSAGANLLIRDGAQVITCVEDLLMLYGLSTSTTSIQGSAGALSGPPLPPEDAALLALLGPAALPSHEIAFLAGLSVRQVSEALLRLELGGLVSGGAGGYRRVIA